MANVTFRPCLKSDKSAITNFLWSIKDELLLSDQKAAAEITQLLFEKGGVLAGYHQDTMVAMLGYFIGEPSRDYANKDLGFIYVTGIAKAHRLSRLMWNGLGYMVRHLHSLGVKEIRCHASEHDPYTNRLYSHFAKRIGEDVTLRGRPAILYGNTIEAVLAYLDKGQARPHKQTEIPTSAPTTIQPTTINESPLLQPSPQPASLSHPVQPSGTLWHCSPCNVWWLSKASASPDSWHLERMAEIDLTAVNNSADPQTGKAPAWNISGPSPLFCPECGTTMKQQNAPQQNAPQQSVPNMSRRPVRT